MARREANTVLVGVDGSAPSIDAIALAIDLAPLLGATVRPAYVHPLGDSSRAAADPLYRTAREALASFVREQMTARGAAFDERRLTVIEDRSAARGLAREAARRGSALIALGGSHRSLFGPVLFGGTADRLLSASPCPVTVAPAGYADRAARLATIGCAFDGSQESRAALAWASALARAARSNLRIITVHKPQLATLPAYQGIPMVAGDEAVQRQLDRRLTVAVREVEADGVAVEGLMLEGQPASLLEEQSNELDLLVAGARGHGPTRAVLQRSVTRALVRNARCPVVVMPREGSRAA